METTKDGGGRHPARNVIGGNFLHLVRLGIRAADDPVILDSLAVMDQVIKRDLPQGPGWRRYNHDGYGQHDDGRAFDGADVGRCWPILTGERAHYELAADRDAKPWINTMEEFANEGGMLPEQAWDAPDLPTADSPVGTVIEFTRFWKESQRREGRNYSVAIHEPQPARATA